MAALRRHTDAMPGAKRHDGGDLLHRSRPHDQARRPDIVARPFAAVAGKIVSGQQNTARPNEARNSRQQIVVRWIQKRFLVGLSKVTRLPYKLTYAIFLKRRKSRSKGNVHGSSGTRLAGIMQPFSAPALRRFVR